MTTCGNEATFDWALIQKELERSDWETDPEDPSYEKRTVWLGTIFGITPSGKFYVPFACGNVAGDCPVCNGEGSIRPRTGKRVRARAKRREHAFSKGVVKRGFMGTPAANAYNARVSKYRMKAFRVTNLTCTACNGHGSISAAKDERWNEALEKSAESIGAYVDHYDDSVFIAQSREREDGDIRDDDDYSGHDPSEARVQPERSST